MFDLVSQPRRSVIEDVGDQTAGAGAGTSDRVIESEMGETTRTDDT